MKIISDKVQVSGTVKFSLDRRGDMRVTSITDENFNSQLDNHIGLERGLQSLETDQMFPSSGSSQENSTIRFALLTCNRVTSRILHHK